MNAAFKIACLCFLLCLCAAPPADAKKIKEQKSLKSVMISISATIGQIQNSLAEEEHFTAAEKLMQPAQLMHSLQRRQPPKGPKTDWDSIHQNIILLAFKAIGACADEDTAAARNYVQHMLNYMQAGHDMFR